MNAKPAHSLFHTAELDETVVGALCDMVSPEPTRRQVESAIRRIRVREPLRRAVNMGESANRRLLARFATAAMLLIGLWLVAQTEAWAQVSIDFQNPGAGERHESAVPIAQPAGPMLRFVLILHVFGLAVGMFGFFASWITGIWRWLHAEWNGTTVGHSRRPVAARTLRAAGICYALGLACGCIWSQAMRNTLWSWNPQEAFPLITLGVGVLWYLNIESTGGDPPTKRLVRDVLVASLSFWLIVLLYSLAGMYDLSVHSYGFPSRWPTWIVCLWVGNVVIVWATHRGFAYRRGR